MIRLLFSLILFTSLCACSETTPKASCIDPFIEKFKCDTELPCNDAAAPSSAPKAFTGWAQEFDFND